MGIILKHTFKNIFEKFGRTFLLTLCIFACSLAAILCLDMSKSVERLLANMLGDMVGTSDIIMYTDEKLPEGWQEDLPELRSITVYMTSFRLHRRDVGCGTGTILRRLSDRADIQGYGVDVSEAMLHEARRKCPQMQFQVGDSARLPFADNSFDVVMTCMAYHHFPSQQDFRREALRILKPHGRLYICDPRFPHPVRTVMNGMFRLSRTNACFYTAEETSRDLAETGFSTADVYKDLYVQMVVCEKM